MPRLFNDRSSKAFRQHLRNTQTRAEWMLWQYLKHRQLGGLKFRRQQGVGKYVVDFYCPSIKLVVEIDGDSHFEAQAIEYDRRRDQELRSFGLKVIRFTNDEIHYDLDNVLERIAACNPPPL